MESLEQRIEKIEERNERVEADKAWETSSTRKVILVLCTYFIIGLFMSSIGVSEPWVNAIVPVLGFILSTLTVPFVKKWWLTKRIR